MQFKNESGKDYQNNKSLKNQYKIVLHFNDHGCGGNPPLEISGFPHLEVGGFNNAILLLQSAVSKIARPAHTYRAA